MKTPKNTLFLLATLFATPAFATWVTLEGGSTAESAVSFADNYSNTTELVLVAPTDATSTYFNANGKTIQYLKADGSANVYVSGGFTIDAPASGNSLLFDGSTNVDSQLTFSNPIEELELAYAITIHKSQGSEFPVGVMIVTNGPPMLYTRNLLYTGVTRAKELLIILGKEVLLSKMIDNVDTKKRNTGLKYKIEKYLGVFNM